MRKKYFRIFFLSRDEKEAATAADDEFVRLSSLQVSFKDPTSAELLNYFISLVRCFSLQFTIFFLSLHSSASIFNVTMKSVVESIFFLNGWNFKFSSFFWKAGESLKAKSSFMISSLNRIWWKCRRLRLRRLIYFQPDLRRLKDFWKPLLHLL